MKSRRFLIALAVIVPLMIFGATKMLADWRPVALGSVKQAGAMSVTKIEASERYVVVENDFAAGDIIYPKSTLFDLETGKPRLLVAEGIADDGAWLWKLQTDQKKPMLWLRDGDKPPVRYALNADALHARTYDVTLFRVRPALNRVEMLVRQRYYRWNKTSRQLERTAKFSFSNGENTALSRDGETLIDADSFSKKVYFGDARTGHLTRRVPVAGIEHNNSARVTPTGAYLLYRAGEQGWQNQHWHIADASNGRALWDFHQVFMTDYFVIARDEKEIALLIYARKLWEIRDLKTGVVLRTLPLVPGARTAAFSPDGATLYCVVGGVLYRQRAR